MRGVGIRRNSIRPPPLPLPPQKNSGGGWENARGGAGAYALFVGPAALEIFVFTDAAMKARLRPASHNQNQTVTCSHFVCSRSEKISGRNTWRHVGAWRKGGIALIARGLSPDGQGIGSRPQRDAGWTPGGASALHRARKFHDSRRFAGRRQCPMEESIRSRWTKRWD